ncbi:MarR family winged helix-turn-helix transcriptional regulator [Succinivibrio dextrinosolvens]|jgi:DNA-binding MarR family transcriptional regulator|uniref:MarR family winged helix-turn-helix transcriptional regulator n=1 Tax=Succinivibrio dextrinosolvens TaxID=83771 RepID=UPI0004E20547|nr:MarR family transcriptional regulator [Succinivibrio dextrinosolvens]
MKYVKNHEYNCNKYITKIKQFNIRIFNQILNEIGCKDFTCEQSFILQALWNGNELTCIEIANETGLAPNTVTALINNLAKNGMVERKSNPKDRRQVIVTATEKGNKAKKDFDTVLEKVVNIGFNNFTDTEYEQFQGYLEKLCKNYERFFNSPLKE